MYFNALTKQIYGPTNQQRLDEAALLLGVECHKVAGFKQWLELGRVVRKGEHGTKILMVCDKKGSPETTTSDGEISKHKVCKSRTVFFETQTTELQASAA